MKRFASGDEDQYQRTLDKKFELQLYWAKVWLIFAGIMIGLVVIAGLLTTVG